MSSTTGSSGEATDHDDQNLLAKTILGFTLAAVLALLSQPINNFRSGHHHDLQWFSFFASLAFGTSFAVLSLPRERGRAIAIFQCLSVASTALAFASIVSLFTESRFRAAVYGLCAVPLCALLPVPWEDLHKQLMTRAKWWKRRESVGGDIEMGMGGDEHSVSIV